VRFGGKLDGNRLTIEGGVDNGELQVVRLADIQGVISAFS